MNKFMLVAPTATTIAAVVLVSCSGDAMQRNPPANRSRLTKKRR